VQVQKQVIFQRSRSAQDDPEQGLKLTFRISPSNRSAARHYPDERFAEDSQTSAAASPIVRQRLVERVVAARKPADRKRAPTKKGAGYYPTPHFMV
jgi:hypothetical protein